MIIRENIQVHFCYRPHHQFLEDVLEGYVLAAALDHFGLKDEKSQPTKNKLPPICKSYSKAAQYEWLCQQATEIRNKLTLMKAETVNISQPLDALQEQEQWIESLKDGEIFYCPHCNATYQMVAWFKKHLAPMMLTFSPAMLLKHIAVQLYPF